MFFLVPYQTPKFNKKHPEKKKDKKLANDLNYEGIEFPVSKKDYCKVKK